MYTHEPATANRRFDVARRYPRFMISIPVVVTRPAMPDAPAVHGLSLDLSLGGVSAVLCGPPLVGETVYLSLQFAEASLESLAVVRHSSSTRSGFEFMDLPGPQRELLENRLQTLLERPWPWRLETGKKTTFVP
jgi:hypothetical protein